MQAKGQAIERTRVLAHSSDFSQWDDGLLPRAHRVRRPRGHSSVCAGQGRLPPPVSTCTGVCVRAPIRACCVLSDTS